MLQGRSLRTTIGLLCLLACQSFPVGAATFTVNNAADDPDGDLSDTSCDTGNQQDGFTGLCTLRAAIQNAAAGDLIDFAAGVDTIAPLSELPPLQASIIGGSGTSPRTELDGSLVLDFLAPGLSVRAGAALIQSLVINRFPGDGLNIRIGAGSALTISDCIIGLDATGLIAAGFGNGGDGIFAELSDNLTIGGASVDSNIISGNAVAGIRIWGRNFLAGPVDGTSILGNRIGTDAAGNLPLGNGASGVILGEDDLALVGTLVDGNVISGNGEHGVELRGKRVDTAPFNADFNRITNNNIGTDAAGMRAIPNQGSGIFLFRNDDSIIGDPDDPGAGVNLISGNMEHGIAFGHVLSDSLTVAGNIIGANRDLSGPLPNGGHGVYLYGGLVGQIGGTGMAPDGLANIIAFNRGDGVAVVEPPNVRTTRFSIRGNAIYDNVGLGIDLNDDGPTPNDALDLDSTGGNNQQNTPVVTSITVAGGMTRVEGFLDDVQNNPHTFDFYANPGGCDISGFGEGDQYLGSAGPFANPAFQVPIPFDVTFMGEFRNVTATATDAAGNTSEFSTCGVPYVVNSVGDQGDQTPGDGFCHTGNFIDGFFECTLRAAIEEANARAGHQTVHFGIPDDQAVAGVFIISVATSLPVIADLVEINAATQKGYQPGMPVVEIRGPGGLAPSWGLQIAAGNTTIRGFSIYRFTKNGILINGPGGNVIEANIVGTNAQSDPALSIGEDGVAVLNSSGNTIGGPSAGQRNLISRNGSAGTGGCGILIIGGADNQIIGNFIGTDVSGTMSRGNFTGGVCLEDAPFNIVGGANPGAGNLISGNAGNGIELRGAQSASATLLGNNIGLDMAGGVALANSGNGILVAGDAGGGHAIGNGSVNGRNIISGNTMSGIRLMASLGGNRIDGNFIGTDITGTVARPNDTGILIQESPMNRIGVGGGNVISGNTSHGILVSRDGALGNQIQENLVGTDPTGLNPVPNGADGIRLAGVRETSVVGNVIANNFGYGVAIFGNDGFGPLQTSQANADNALTSNWIGAALDGGPAGNGIDGVTVSNSGGNRVGAGNLIRSNGSNGISVVYETYGEHNVITASGVFENIALGIDLGRDFVTANDPMDVDAGANALQNHPEVTNIVGAPLNLVQGTLNSAPNKTYVIELFSNVAADPSGRGEGQEFEGAFGLTTDANGQGFFIGGFGKGLSGHCISATARAVATGDTSEFSPCILIPPAVPDNLDFGDAPDVDGQYPTLLASNGARHKIILGVILGSTIDADGDGQPNGDASGDDTDGGDDEGGVVFVSRLETFASQAQIEVSASAAGVLDAWVDFNGDGDFDDSSDRIFADEPVSPGVNVLNFAIPIEAVPGTTFARFRYSTAGGLGPLGPALDGEVEDYAVEVIGPVIFANGFE